jgi:ferredoxin
MKTIPKSNTLLFYPRRCTNCSMCSIVCPQGVFIAGDTVARMVNRQACIECGACMLNCEAGAIFVQAGVGCAAAMIQASLKGQQEPICGSDCDCC